MKNYTETQFLQKIQHLNLTLIDNFINTRTKVKVKNKYGVCEVLPSNLIKGVSPTIQTALDKTSYFINQAVEIHDNIYDYTSVVYINNKQKVKIICPKHGIFLQSPAMHLQKQGCKECKRYTRSDNNKLSTKEFIIKANNKHDDTYNYNKSVVNGSKHKIIITCKVHGDFLQSPNSHLQGSGCKKCALLRQGYGKSRFVSITKGNYIFYIIEMYDENERFIKIGITSDTVKLRFSKSKLNNYQYINILEVASTDANYIWELESNMKKKFKNYRYKTTRSFKGRTECFTLDIKEELLKSVNL